ncbi:histidine kinase [Saccharopolyspora sp. K220]|uniref:sensor histidine kinase n=1 Tax=Saccharopolyspora soli TaxID=2926618 RepID=UPI001F575C7E|nr:histidine kinase [Saccharopolyspora soli]MCI2418889.1 histidine kinase [Saccharopolyspora soli]
MSSFVTSPKTEPAEPWWRRFGAFLHEQWIFAALLGLVWSGDALALLTDHGRSPLLILPITAMAVLAIFGRRHPVRCGLAAAVLLCGTTAVVRLTDANVYSLGLESVLPTENLAGLLLVLYLFQFRPVRKAIVVTAALVVACLAAVVFRDGTTYSLSQTVGFGFLQLLLATGTGLYLRGKWLVRDDALDSPIRVLLRRQWPVIAALSILLFLEFARSNGSLIALVVVLLGGLVMSVLAVFAPMRPVEAAMLGSVALVLTALVMRFLGLEAESGLLGPVPISSTGAGMLLLTFATRHAEPRRAVRSGVALVAAALFALFVTPLEGGSYGDLSDQLQSVFLGGLLLAISVGTGMYFRARDEERAKSVQAAVSDAQHAERMALARELHDVVAHHVTGIVVQAQAAQLVAAQNPKAATDALARISESGTEALTAMRRLVASMRGAEPAGASEATEQATTNLEADLQALVAATQRVAGHAGAPTVNLRVDLGREIPPEVARSALRVVQESLTNAEKHALDASYVQVDVRADLANLYALITDDGTMARRQPVGGSGGYGLVGMRERIELLGGRFRAGPGEHVGWRVEVVLPLAEQTEEVGQR